ncbi:hypothetical protein RhiirA5_400742 [Rhizophagus irregularis]|uniref:MIR domain-containing protein n=1 Tax=Rhizophagus irregularis TaxID=588596 RepID=A0A2N0PG50_9GLOM|nr:hypothetical protein RhiirA5_400742 [Rhizophagus irregularis]
MRILTMMVLPSLKHIATGKYLSSCNKKYQNSNYNLVYCGDNILNNDALWIISNNNITNLITFQNSITLKHKSSSNNYLSVDSDYKACGGNEGLTIDWTLQHSKNERNYLESKDNVLLKISFGKNTNVKNLTLRSHENILKIDNNDYQEVFAHENRIGGIDEVFLGDTEPLRISFWKIKFDKDYATIDTFMTLQQRFDKFLGLRYNYSNYYKRRENYHKSPSQNTEVSCNVIKENDNNNKWRFDTNDLNYQGCLKSNDIITLSIKNEIVKDRYEFLRGHDFQVNIGKEVYEEVVCHNKGIGVNDNWCIELIE